MNTYIFILLCFSTVACLPTAKSIPVDAPALHTKPDNLRNNESNVLRKLFMEISNAMETILVSKDSQNQDGTHNHGNIVNLKTLSDKMKRKYFSNKTLLQEKGNSSFGKAIEAFEGIFNKMTKVIDRLYTSTTKSKDNRNKLNIKNITPLRRSNSLKPVLERLRKFDRLSSRIALYYEEGSGNEIEIDSPQTIIGKGDVKTINSVEVSGDGEDDYIKQVNRIPILYSSHRNKGKTFVPDDTESSTGDDQTEINISGSGSGMSEEVENNEIQKSRAPNETSHEIINSISKV